FVACGLVCGLSCPTGQFRSSVPGLCCNLCPVGHFMSKECQTLENFVLNNQCVPCDRCHKGEFVVEECSPKRNTVCRKLPTSTRPSSTPHINSQEPVTGTKLVERVDHNPTPAEIKAQKRFQDEMWVYRAVIMLLVLIILGLVLHKKMKLCQTIKTKVTTLKKCSGPKVVQRNESQSCREHLLELREKDKHIQNIERQLMELEEQVREKDEQQQNSQSQLTIFRGDGEREGVNFQKHFHLKLKELADLEKELRDCEQDNVELQRELSTAKEKLNKCESLLTTREWLISRDEIEIMSEKFLGEGGYGKVFIGRYRGFVVAVKALKSLTFTPRERDLFEREMDIASRCRHPCLLQFIGATQGESPLFVTDSANVLLWKQNDQWRGKLGDYGTVKFLQEIMTVDAGAMIYSAPEAGNPYNQTVK
ncbi:unnamed protein product, partial [Porites evermanni]